MNIYFFLELSQIMIPLRRKRVDKRSARDGIMAASSSSMATFLQSARRRLSPAEEEGERGKSCNEARQRNSSTIRRKIGMLITNFE